MASLGPIVVVAENPATDMVGVLGAYPIDIAGDGRMDLVICHDYGECMFDCRPQDGKISWLRNPGKDDAGEWEVRHVGDLVAAHRLRLGRFTGAGPELLALPVVGPGGGVGVVSPPGAGVTGEGVGVPGLPVDGGGVLPAGGGLPEDDDWSCPQLTVARVTTAALFILGLAAVALLAFE